MHRLALLIRRQPQQKSGDKILPVDVRSPLQSKFFVITRRMYVDVRYLLVDRAAQSMSRNPYSNFGAEFQIELQSIAVVTACRAGSARRTEHCVPNGWQNSGLPWSRR